MELKEGPSINNKHLWIYHNNLSVGFIKLKTLNNILEIDQIYINPKYRGNNYAKKSIEILIKDYKHFNKIILWAYGNFNFENKLFKYYESIGFIKVGKPTMISINNNDYIKQYMKYILD